MNRQGFNAHYRYGSAAWADTSSIAQAGLMNGKGLFLGYKDNRQIRISSDAPMLTIGGAGSGKTRDLLGFVVCSSPGLPMLVLDPRGELEAISRMTHTLNGEYAYRWNPANLLGAGTHVCNVLDILDPCSTSFHSDCKFIAEGMISLSGGGNARYFEQRSRAYAECLIKHDATVSGYTSLPRFYRTVNTIEGDPETWGNTLEAMLMSPHEDVRRTAGEMITKQTESPKEFGSVLAEIYNAIGFLSDPALLTSLEDPRDADNGRVCFSLSELCRGHPVRKIFIQVPSEMLSLWSPVLRLFYTTAMMYKARAPEARRVLFLIDEAGQMGRFGALLRAVTFGRGAGIKTWSIWQGIGQIRKNFSHEEAQTLIGSCQVRQFFGVRDYDTAKLVSDMLGKESLHYDDTLAQSEAAMHKRATLQKVMQGEDPFTLGHQMAHYRKASRHQSMQARDLMAPEEILSLQEDRQILFISGLNLKPILGEKHPYYTRPEMAGLYLANPYHPPTDSVRVQGFFDSKSVPVITAPVPDKYAVYPQNSEGYWSYCAV